MAKAMAKACGDVRRGRTPLALLALGGVAWLLQAVAFALAGSPRIPPKVLTARAAEEEGSVGVLPTKMTDLRVGQELQGIVTQVRERIALVDVGVEKVGLLPASKLLDARTPDDMNDKLTEGQPITVYVSEVTNPEDPRQGKFVLSGHKNKIVNLYALGNRSDLADVQALVEAQKSQEEKTFYTGVVTAVKPDLGILVSLRVPDVPGIISGLVYKTEVKGSPDVLQQVKVRILEAVDERRIRLSMRDQDPLTGDAAKFGAFRDLVETTVKGTVTGFQDYGAFVEVTSPSGNTQKALLPNAEIKADTVPEDPAELLEIGQELPLKILQITDKGILVSAKQAEEA